MNNLLRISVFLLMSVAFFSAGSSQILFEENFDYPAGDSLRAHGWNITGTSTISPVSVSSPGLTYTGYHSSGIGNAVSLVSTGQDVHDTLTSPVTSGSLYASFMVNVSAAQTGDYFFHFTRTTAPTTDFYARTFVRLANNGNLAFGIAKFSVSTTNPVRYSDSVYTLNTTYLLVVKYRFVSATTTDDEVSLYVIEAPSLPLSEPATPTVGPVTTTQTDVAELGLVALRQGTSSSAPTLRIDGIQVGTDWGYAPLPVQLSAFTATRSGHSSAHLRWRTASETNNYGFYVQRRSVSEAGFRDLPGSFIAGAGTTFLSREYSYTDNTIGAGGYHYRLRQVDLNGDVHFSEPIQLDGVSSAGETVPALFALEQNYPNPFNPATTIRFTIGGVAALSGAVSSGVEGPHSSHVTLKVFDILGREVATLVDGVKEAGEHRVEWNADGVTSGIYICRLESGTQTATRKLTLLK